jgi:hypothetical protein
MTLQWVDHIHQHVIQNSAHTVTRIGTKFVVFCIFWRCMWLWDYGREFCAILKAIYREVKVSSVITTKVASGVKVWMQQVAAETQAHGFISHETVIFKCQASHVKYWNNMLVLVAALHLKYSGGYHDRMGTRWRSWLRHWATSRKVAGSIPDGVIGIFHWHNPSGRTMALGLTQLLTEMSTRNISWGWRRPVRRSDNLTTSCADCLEILEPQPPGTLRACPGL